MTEGRSVHDPRYGYFRRILTVLAVLPSVEIFTTTRIPATRSERFAGLSSEYRNAVFAEVATARSSPDVFLTTNEPSSFTVVTVPMYVCTSPAWPKALAQTTSVNNRRISFLKSRTFSQ